MLDGLRPTSRHFFVLILKLALNQTCCLHGTVHGVLQIIITFKFGNRNPLARVTGRDDH